MLVLSRRRSDAIHPRPSRFCLAGYVDAALRRAADSGPNSRQPRHLDLKVFAISGTRLEDLGIHTGPTGLDAWFPKPLDVGKLWDAIQHSLASAPARN
jgi:hypothetical protein